MLYEANRACTSCSLRDDCKGPVPAVGQGRVMLIGEAPGANEDVDGRPFTGKAGKYLDGLLRSAGIDRSSVIISNTVKCRPLRNRTPTRAEATHCASRWLDVEVLYHQPDIVVPMGKVAIEHFLGSITVEHTHGIPIQGKGYTILPVYHPAAGLHNTTLMRSIQSDFQVLGKLVRGEVVERPVDDWQDTDWDVELLYNEAIPDHFTSGSWIVRPPYLGNPGGIKGLHNAGDTTTAWDTETVDGKLWSIQGSSNPGEAAFYDVEKWEVDPGEHGIVHNYMYDAQWMDLPRRTDDTMVMAYVLGLPQGLKELAWRLCGMEMASYTDTIGGHRKAKAMAWLTEAAKLEWPAPPLLEDVSWSKKENKLVTQSKRPKPIIQKIRRIIADVVGGKELKSGPVDAWTRWHQIDARERAVVEEALGPMPDASLADVPRAEAIHYAARDADATLRVYNELKPMLSEMGLDYVYEMDRGTLPIALEMQSNGIRLDVDYLRNLGRHYLELMEAKAEEIFKELGGKRFNPNSDDQLRTIFYEELGYKPTRYTETGLPSVKGEELAKISHPAVPMIEAYKHLAHLKDSFCDTLPDKVNQAGRICPTVNVTRTETGRWSMKNPNLQQIPSRTELGKAIRKAFTSNKRTSLVAIDYSQIEMRVAAHLARCRSMTQLFLEGRDIHTETASQIFGIPLEDVTPRHRYPTKTMGFGVIYGLTPHGLHNQMVSEGLEDWTAPRCEEFITEYYRLRPELKAWQEMIKDGARRDGYVRDMFGRIRYTPELLCPLDNYRSAGERQAINMPVQSSAGGIIKLAMAKMQRMYLSDPHGHIPWEWLLAIHDEIMVEVLDEDVDGFISWASQVMESAVKLSVPVLVEAKAGKNWAEMESRVLTAT